MNLEFVRGENVPSLNDPLRWLSVVSKWKIIIIKIKKEYIIQNIYRNIERKKLRTKKMLKKKERKSERETNMPRRSEYAIAICLKSLC